MPQAGTYLTASEREQLWAAVRADGWAPTYRAAGIGETTLRSAVEGHAISGASAIALRAFIERWQKQSETSTSNGNASHG